MITHSNDEVVTLRDGSRLHVRPIEPDDAARLERMFDRLSPATVYRRFFSPIHHPTESMLRHLATVDHQAREALVALVGDEIVAVARYDDVGDAAHAEMAVTVEDAWQHRGLGRRLSRRLAVVAAEHGYEGFVARMLGENREAMRLLRGLSPDATVRFADGEFGAEVPLPHAS